MKSAMTCPYCNGEFARVRTDSPWEFELWCEPCVKHIGVASYAHDKEPPAPGGDVLSNPPSSVPIQGDLF